MWFAGPGHLVASCLGLFQRLLITQIAVEGMFDAHARMGLLPAQECMSSCEIAVSRALHRGGPGGYGGMHAEAHSRAMMPPVVQVNQYVMRGILAIEKKPSSVGDQCFIFLMAHARWPDAIASTCRGPNGIVGCAYQILFPASMQMQGAHNTVVSS